MWSFLWYWWCRFCKFCWWQYSISVIGQLKVGIEEIFDWFTKHFHKKNADKYNLITSSKTAVEMEISNITVKSEDKLLGIITFWKFKPSCKSALQKGYEKPLSSKSRSSCLVVFLGKDGLEICTKLTGEHPFRSVVSIKLLCKLYWNYTSAWVLLICCIFSEHLEEQL